MSDKEASGLGSVSDNLETPTEAGSGTDFTESIDISNLFSQRDPEAQGLDAEGVEASTFGRLLQAVPIPAAVLGLGGVIVYANHVWSIIGVEPEQAVGLDLPCFVSDAETSRAVTTIIEEVKATGKPGVCEGWLGRGGARIWGKMCFSSLKVVTDRTVLCLIQDLTAEKERDLVHQKNREELESRVAERTTDLERTNEMLRTEIAERKQAEEALRESEQRYRQVVDNANDIIFLTDASGCFTMVNQVCLRITGFDEEEVIGLSYMDLIHPDYREEVERFYGRQFTKKIPDTYYECPIVNKTGEMIWLGQNVRIIVEGGEVVGFSSICRDITERKQAEDALKESEEKYRLVVENTNESIFIVQDDKVEFANTAALGLSGYTAEALASKSWMEFLHPEDRKPASESREEDSDEQFGPRRYAVRLVDKEGRTRWGYINVVELNWKAKPASLVFVSDITELKQAEAALRESEERYRLLVEHTPLGIVSCDTEGQIIDINRTMAEMLGAPSVGTARKLNMFSFRPLVDSGISEDVRACLASGESVVSERPFTDRMGARLYVSVHVVARRDFDGFIVGSQAVIEDITTRKLAERSLMASEEKYRTIIENIEEGYYEMDLEGNMAFFNDSMARILGYARQQLTGLSFRTYMDEVNSAKVFEALRTVLDSGRPAPSFGWELIRQDGSTRIVETSVSLMRDSFNRPIGFRGICRDVTERKQSEAALRESEDKYRALFEQAADSIVLKDAETGEIVEFNERAYENLGYTREEFGTLKLTDIEALAAPEAIHERMELLVKDGSGSYETQHRKKDGSLTDVLVRSRAVSIKGRDFILSIFVDITDRRRAEEQIAVFRSFAEASGQGFGIANLDRGITYANPALCRFLGEKDPEDVIGKSLVTYHDEPDATALEKQILPDVMNGVQWVGETVLKDRLGMMVPVIENLFLIRDEKNEPSYLATVITDISERKQMESRLRQAQKLEAIGTLAGGIAHDFNNILMAMLAYTEMTAKLLPEETRAHQNLAEVLRAGNRAVDLIRQILTFSRKNERRRRPLQIHVITREVLRLLRATIPSTIEIRQDIDRSSGWVLGDPTQIHQVIMNLCTNAYQAMEDKPGVLEVRLHETTLSAESPVVGRRHTDMKPGPAIQLMVKDTGHGMSSDTLERIFEPYFTTKSMGKGTGMGLAVVHGIVQSYGGAIQVESKPGEGTTFNVFLPVCDPPTQFGAAEQPAVEGGTETILFVDDETQIKSAGKNILQSYGYTVSAHTDPREALETFEKSPNKFDLVITDLTMPHLTGFQLAGELISIRADIPIILCTGYRDSISPEEVEHMGIRTILTKPLTHTDLGRVVHRILEQERKTDV